MERQPGAYIMTKDGRLEPDLNDEAMKKRQGLAAGDEGLVEGQSLTTNPQSPKKKEVKENAISE